MFVSAFLCYFENYSTAYTNGKPNATGDHYPKTLCYYSMVEVGQT